MGSSRAEVPGIPNIHEPIPKFSNPPECSTPQILVPPSPIKQSAKISTPLSLPSKRNTMKPTNHTFHGCKCHLKNEVSFNCFFVFETLASKSWVYRLQLKIRFRI